MGMCENRDYASTLKFISQKVVAPDRVKTVVMDMWEPFHKAVRKVFPYAQIVIDKYHVVQKVTQALDDVRKKIPGLKKSRFVLLKSDENLKDWQKEKLDELLETYEQLSYSCGLKELFRDIYRFPDYETAEVLLAEWIQLAWSSPFPSFHEVAKTIENWKPEILQYFKTPYTNGQTEGTNHKIKTSNAVLDDSWWKRSRQGKHLTASFPPTVRSVS